MPKCPESKCPEYYCHWVNSTRDPDRYICLRCEKVRRVDTDNSDGGSILVFMLVAVALLVLLL